MRRKRLGPILLAVFFAIAVNAQDDSLHGLDQYIEKAMADWQIPGLAVAVVKGDKVVFIRGYGTRQIGRDAPVDVHTLFPFGSTTKAFTALAVAMLVDEGKLSWDEPVSKHLPWLEFADPWVTRTVTVRDLLSHRVAGGWGGSSYPFILVVGGFTPNEILHRMHYLGGDGSGFRSRFEYDNANYWAAGELVATISGMPWQDFVRSRIFKPLGMRSAKTYILWNEKAVVPCFECGLEGHTVSLEDALVENIAVPHRLGDAGPETAPTYRAIAEDPSGGITADIEDAAKWLRFQLQKGSFEGKRLLRPEVFGQMHTPQISVPAEQMPDLKPGSGNFWAYGFGWYLTDYRSRKAVMHGGGFMSYIGMLPEDGLGVAVLANLPSQFRQALIFHIFDLYLSAPERDWRGEMLAKTKAQRERRRAQLEKAEADRPPGVKPPIPLEGYVGTYSHRAYGDIIVTQENGRLVLRFARGQVGDLEYWEDDKFRVNWRGPYHFRTFVTFTTSPQGHVKSLRFEFPAAEFTRIPEPGN